MANGGPHTGKSQFYITLGDRSYLDGDYTVFGEVYGGIDVVFTIAQGDPMERVRIVRVGEEAGAFRPTTESFRQMRREVWTRVRAQEEAQLQEDLAYIQASWPHAVTAESGLRYVLLREGSGAVPQAGDTLHLRYAGRTLRGLGFASTAETGVPYFFLPGDSFGGAFPLVVGES
ncbi:peptidylprolyl isomerase, partial [Gemmatimonadota bacterium]